MGTKARIRYLLLLLMLALAACSTLVSSYVPCPTGVITITDPQADCPAGMPE